MLHWIFETPQKKPAKYLGGVLFGTIVLPRRSSKFMAFISSSDYL